MDKREQLRARGERDLAKILLSDPHIKSLIERYEKTKKQEARRYLLGTSVRLTPSMTPDVHDIVEHCRSELEVERPVEIYVSPNPGFNAFSYGGDEDHVIIGLTSALLEAFEPDELRFVLGHELGHVIFRHHDVPVGALVRGPSGIPPKKALQIFQWQRYAEISSDRAGLVCSGDMKATGRAFFKIASGLRGSRVNLDIEAYLDQITDIEAEAAKAREGEESLRADWFASHPFSPLRIRAAQLCAESVVFKDEGTGVDELESQVQELMSIMEPSYLLDTTPTGEAMRRLLLAGGVLVAAAVDGVSDEELKALGGFLGEDNLPDEVNPEALRADLDERIELARKTVPPLRLGQLIRDLAVISLASGHQHEEELAVVYELAEELGVDRTVVERSIESAQSGLD